MYLKYQVLKASKLRYNKTRRKYEDGFYKWAGKWYNRNIILSQYSFEEKINTFLNDLKSFFISLLTGDSLLANVLNFFDG